jgi:hypothetical protein
MALPGKKSDFLDDVVDEMGPSDKGGDDEYGAKMSVDDGDGMDDESDPEEAQQDRIMAAKAIGKALGSPPGFDAVKLADALHAFVANCMDMDHGG